MEYYKKKKRRKVWTPKNLNLDLWLDASDASTITLNGSNVTQIIDKSGNNRNAVQAVASNQPVYDSANKRLQFDFDFLNVTNATGIAKNIGEMHCFAVCQYSAITTDAQAILHISRGDVDVSSRFMLGQNLSLGSAGMQVAGRRLDADSFQQVSNGTKLTAKLIQHGNIDWKNSNAYLYVNGSLNASNANFQTDGNTSNTDSLAVRLGGISSGNAMFAGYLYELIIVAGVLADTQRQQIEGYLAHKHNLTAYLPVNHPYKYRRP